MAVVVLEDDSNRINDAEALGTWAKDGTTPTLEQDFYYQGSAAISSKVGTAKGGFYFTSGTTITVTDVSMLKCLWTTKDKFAPYPAGTVKLGASGVTNGYEFYIADDGTYNDGTAVLSAKGGWTIVPIAFVPQWIDGKLGTPGTVNTWGINGDFTASSKAENVAMDAIDYTGLGGLYLTRGDSTDTDGDWEDFWAYDEGQTSNRFGHVTKPEGLEGVYSCYGRLTIGATAAGATTNPTVFTSSPASLAFPGGRVYAGWNMILPHIGNASTVITFNDTNVSGQGFDALKVFYDTELDIDNANDYITLTDHGFTTGDPVYMSDEGVTSAEGLTTGTLYWVRRVDANNFSLHRNATAANIVRSEAAGNTSKVALTPVSAGNGQRHSLRRACTQPWLEVRDSLYSTTRSYQFDNATWTKGASVSASANSGLDPYQSGFSYWLGTTSNEVDRLTLGAAVATGSRPLVQTTPSMAVDGDYVVSFWARKISGNGTRLSVFMSSVSTSNELAYLTSKWQYYSFALPRVSTSVIDIYVDDHTLFTADVIDIWDFQVADLEATVGDFIIDGGAYQGLQRIKLQPGCAVSNAKFIGCGSILLQGGTLDGCTISDFNAMNDDTYPGASAVRTHDLTLISNCVFDGVSATTGEGHAIQITQAGVYAFDNNGFFNYSDGYAEFSTAQAFTSELITTDAAHGFTSGEAVYYEKGSGTASIGPTAGNLYYVRVASTTTLYLHETQEAVTSAVNPVNMTTSGTETHYLYSAHAAVVNSSGSNVTINWSGNDGTAPSVRNIGTSTTTVASSVPVSFLVRDKDNLPVENAIASMYLTADDTEILNGATSALGVLSGAYSGTVPADVYWRVRKGSSGDTKYYPASGTAIIQAGSGLALTVGLRVNPYNNATT